MSRRAPIRKPERFPKPEPLRFPDVFADAGGDGPSATTIEDWEDNEIGSEWTVDASGFEVAEDATLEGDYLLRATGSFQRLWSFDGDGLPVYPSRGSEITFLSNNSTSDGYVAGIYYGAGDEENNYFTRHDSGEYELVKKIGNSNTTMDSAAGAFDQDTPYKWRIIWDDGTLGGSEGDHRLIVEKVSDGSEIVDFTVNDTSVEDEGFTDPNGLGIWCGQSDDIEVDYLRKEQ